MKLSEQYREEAESLLSEAERLDDGDCAELSDSTATHRRMKADWLYTLAMNRQRDADYFEERGH